MERRHDQREYYLPEGTGVEVLAYWQPPTAVVQNDTMCVMSKAKNPVLAHLFIDHLLDEANAEENFGFVGYQPAIEGLGAQELIDAAGARDAAQLCALERADRRRASVPAVEHRGRDALE